MTHRWPAHRSHGTAAYAGKPLYEFGIREAECIQHIACFGRTGAGKTNMGFLLFRQFHKKGKPILVFDWKKNYRDLLALPGFQDLEVYTIGQGLAPLSFNPLIPPPGTQPKTWLKKIIQVIAHAYMLGNGVLYMLQQALDAVYEEHGVYTGQVKTFPTFRDVLAKVQNREAHGVPSSVRKKRVAATSSATSGFWSTAAFMASTVSGQRGTTRSTPVFGRPNWTSPWSKSTADVTSLAQSTFPKPPFIPRRIMARRGGSAVRRIVRISCGANSRLPFSAWAAMRLLRRRLADGLSKALPYFIGRSMRSVS